jgi:hypothetical protein
VLANLLEEKSGKFLQGGKLEAFTVFLEFGSNFKAITT